MDSTAIAEPAHIRAAPSHPDPYPYYRRLMTERPLAREDASGSWVAASAAAVMAVLASPICFTRPADGAVPEILRGTPVAEIFGRLVRMRDDARHCPLKHTVTATLQSADMDGAAELARDCAAEFGAALRPERDGESLTRFLAALPVHVIARLLGVPRERVEDAGRWVADYGAAFGAATTGVPEMTPALLAAGSEGATRLLTMFETMPGDAPTLFGALLREAERDEDRASVIANGIGFMVQGFGAIASLSSTTLLALSRHEGARAMVRKTPRLLSHVIQEVLRCDPSTQSTLRFVARDGEVGGRAMRAGDVIVVSLAAANRDPALNPRPDSFDIFRAGRRHLEFGLGRHACPGDRLATLIAEIAVAHALAQGVAVEELAARVAYRPSAHIRIPFFR